jgi:hypothetical protein
MRMPNRCCGAGPRRASRQGPSGDFRRALACDLDHVPVDQQISLWSDDSWWGGGGSHSGSNSGYPLSSWFTVDSNHWYTMWVWTGGSVYGSGWGTFSGSGAGASLKTGTPSISLVLY